MHLYILSISSRDVRRFEGRPPLLDTLTGGRPPGRKVPDPFGGAADDRPDEKRRHRLSGAIVTTPEKPREAYCADGPYCRLANWMGAKDSNLERHAPRDDQAPLDVFEVSGSIKWFDPSKGYGFIVPDRDLPDILLHVSCLRRAGFQTAYEGARVVCEAVQSPKGLHAVRILAIDELTAIRPSQLPQRTHVVVAPESGWERAWVKWFNRVRGFGFLTRGSETPDIFVHMETSTAIRLYGVEASPSGFRALR